MIDKKYLMDCKDIRKRLEHIETDIASTRANAGAVTAMVYTDEPRGRGEPISGAERYAMRLEGLEMDKQVLMVDYQRRKSVIKAAIVKKLPKELGMLILYRYVQNMSWHEVNKKLGIASQSKSMYMHKQAIKLLNQKA